MPLRAVAAVLLLAASAFAAEERLGPAERDFDQLHLDLVVEPDIRAGTVRGEARLTFASRVDGLGELRLHCADTTVLSATDSAGRALKFSAADGILRITLAAPLASGAEETVSIRYESRPTRGLYFHFPTEERPYIPLSLYSQGQSTDNRHWIPCYDEPDDRLTLTLTAVIPDELVSVGNGVCTDRRDLEGPKKEEVWLMKGRLPTYLISLAVGPYETMVFDGETELHVNVFPGLLEETVHAFLPAADMIPFFGEWIGTPYPYRRYAQTTVWEFLYGGMENSTATTMNLRLVHGPETEPNFSAESIVAHELAHQWFGDLLTCRTWHHIWLNEGFATYFADLWFEHSDGVDDFRYRRWRQTRGYLGKAPAPEDLGLERGPRGDRPLELFGGKQYDRGAAILHMLRLELGDETFRRGVGRYVREHADSAVVTEDFRRAMEAEAGRDLGWFFDQWVYGAGYPVLRIGIEERDRAVHLHVEQSQEEGGGQGLFRLDLPVRVATTAGPVTARLPIRRREQEFRIPVEGDVLHVRADDGAWLLGRTVVKQDFEAWADQARTDSDPIGRIEAVEILPRYGGRGLDVVAEVLSADAFWAVRVEAAENLDRAQGKRAALSALLAATGDPDSRVREAAWDALGGFPRDAAGDDALRAVREEPHPYVRAGAARALGRMHHEAAFEALSGLLDVSSHREVVRHGALDGLAALGDRRAVALAKPFLEHRWGGGAQSAMRKSALDAILRLAPDDRATRSLVIGLLDDPYFRMREWAANACGRYEYTAAANRLREMAKADPHPGARRAATRALEDLDL